MIQTEKILENLKDLLFNLGDTDPTSTANNLIKAKNLSNNEIRRITKSIALDPEHFEIIKDIVKGKQNETSSDRQEINAASPEPNTSSQDSISALMNDPRFIHMINTSIRAGLSDLSEQIPQGSDTKKGEPFDNPKAVSYMAPRPASIQEKLSLPMPVLEELFSTFGYPKEIHGPIPGLTPVGSLFRAIFGEHEFITAEDILLKIPSLNIPPKFLNLLLVGFYRILLDHKEHILASSNSEKDPRSAPELDSLLKSRRKASFSRRPNQRKSK